MIRISLAAAALLCAACGSGSDRFEPPPFPEPDLAEVQSAGVALTPVGAFRVRRGGGHGLSFSPDGTRLVTAGSEGDLILWDASTLEILGEWQGHPHWVGSVLFDPSGERILSACAAGTLHSAVSVACR